MRLALLPRREPDAQRQPVPAVLFANEERARDHDGAALDLHVLVAKAEVERVDQDGEDGLELEDGKLRDDVQLRQS